MDLNELEAAIGHEFREKDLLLQALTHSSHSHEHAGDRDPGFHNEQLEFLGDAVLGFVISRELVDRFPKYSEGQLSKMKAHLVSASHLYGAACEVRLGEFLQLGRGEEKSGGRQKRALLVDAMEAVIAAVYLDGGLEKASDVVQKLLVADSLEAGIEAFPFDDYKSALQEYLQASSRPQPRYNVTGERGPEHRKTFTVEVRVARDFDARADGPTKKMAEQEAARAALAYFRELDRVRQEADETQETDQEVNSEQ